MTPWIDVKNGLPPLPKKVFDYYFVIIERDGRILHRMAKWEKRIKRGEALSVESINKQLLKSNRVDWRVANFKSKEVTHWMPIPPLEK